MCQPPYIVGGRIGGVPMRQGAKLAERDQRRLAVAEHQVLAAIDDADRASEVHDHPDVIGRVGREHRARSLIAHSVRRAGQHHEPRQHLEPEVDVERDVGQGLDVMLQHQAAEGLAEDRRPLARRHAVEREAHRAVRQRLHGGRQPGRGIRRTGFVHGRHGGSPKCCRPACGTRRGPFVLVAAVAILVQTSDDVSLRGTQTS